MEICLTVHVLLLSVGWSAGDFFFLGWLDAPRTLAASRIEVH